MDNSEKDEVIRRIIEICHMPTSIKHLKSELAHHLAKFGETNGEGVELTGEGTVETISKIKKQLFELEKDIEKTQDIRKFFLSFH